MAGQRVRRLRRERGLTQARMAAQLGISTSYLNLIERSQRPVTVPFLLKLGQAFDVDLQRFAEDDEGRVVAALREVFGDPLFARSQVTDQDIRDAAQASPALGDAIALLFRAYRALLESTANLAEGAGPAESAAPAQPGLPPAAGAPGEEVQEFMQARSCHLPELEEAAARPLGRGAAGAGDPPRRAPRRAGRGARPQGPHPAGRGHARSGAPLRPPRAARAALRRAGAGGARLPARPSGGAARLARPARRDRGRIGPGGGGPRPPGHRAREPLRRRLPDALRALPGGGRGRSATTSSCWGGASGRRSSTSASGSSRCSGPAREACPSSSSTSTARATCCAASTAAASASRASAGSARAGACTAPSTAPARPALEVVEMPDGARFLTVARMVTRPGAGPCAAGPAARGGGGLPALLRRAPGLRRGPRP